MFLFETLSRENCVAFLILSVLSFAAFIVLFVFALTSAKNKSLYFIASLSPLLMYYLYLMWYSMCVSSLK